MIRRISAHLSRIDGTDLLAYALLGAIGIARFVYVGSMDLVADEAYYWDWSRNPAFGYFDHPPMVAWLIFVFVKLFGDTALGVKGCAVACSLVASVSAYRIVKKYVRNPSSLILYILLSSSVILYGVGSLLATPDIPMVACWAVGMLAAYKMIFEHSPYAWIGLGCSMGLGMMSKYSFALFIVSMVLFLACFKEHRKMPAAGRFIAAFFLAAALFVPNIIWNANHRWISVLFQLGHGIGATGFPRWDFFGDYFGGQAGMLSVLPFAIILWGAGYEARFHAKTSSRAFLLIFFAVPFLAFAASSLQKRVEPNWPCGAYISGLALIPLLVESVRPRLKKVLRRILAVSVLLSIAATLAVMAHIKRPCLPIPSRIDPTMQIHGWKGLCADIQARRETIDPSGAVPLCANSYQDASYIAFYLPDHPHTLALNINSRPNQYSLSPRRERMAGQKALFISTINDSCTLPSSVSIGLDSIRCAATAYRRPDARTKIPYGVFTARVRNLP